MWLFDEIAKGVVEVVGGALDLGNKAVGGVVSTAADAAVATTGLVKDAAGSIAHSAEGVHWGVRSMLGKTDPARTVFVVHGRQPGAWEAMRDFLALLGLNPLNYDVLETSAELHPGFSVQDVLRLAFQKANAVVVLFTPDEHAVLDSSLHVDADDHDVRRVDRHQARPNVFFEAGIAFAQHANHTVLVTFGDDLTLSDLRGVEPITFTRDDRRTREKLVARLHAAKVALTEPADSKHLEPGSFQAVLDQIALRKRGTTSDAS